MVKFESFSCTSAMIESIRSPVERDLLIHLYCSAKYYMLNFSDFYYRKAGQSVLLLLIFIFAFWLLMLLVQWKLTRAVLVPAVLGIKNRLKLSPFLATLLILTPMEQFVVMLSEREATVSVADYHVLCIAYVVATAFILIGLALPVLLLHFKKDVVLPKYTLYVINAFHGLSLLVLLVWMINTRVNYLFVAFCLLCLAAFVYFGFWVKEKDEEFERLLAEEKGLIEGLERELDKAEGAEDENQGLMLERPDEDELRASQQNQGQSRTESQNRSGFSRQNRSELGLGSQMDSERPDRSQSQPDQNASELAFERRRKERMAKRISLAQQAAAEEEGEYAEQLVNEILKEVIDPERSMFYNLAFLPLTGALVLGVPYLKNPLLQTYYKYVLVFSAILLIIWQIFGSLSIFILVGIAMLLTAGIFVTDFYIKNKNILLSIFEALSFIEIAVVLALIDIYYSDSFSFFEFYFSVNPAVVYSLLNGTKVAVDLFIISYWLMRSKEEVAAILNFYTWPIIAVFLSFPIWTGMAIFYGNSEVTFLKKKFNPELEYFDLYSMIFVKWIFLFSVILFAVRGFYSLAVDRKTSKKMSSVFLGVYCSMLLISIPFMQLREN